MEIIKKSFLSGIMISIAATVNLLCGNKILGACLFAVGLFAICSFSLNLFTGCVGRVIADKAYKKCLLIWTGNFIGCIVASTIIRIANPQIHEMANQIVTNKMSHNFLSTAILSAFCGELMYIAVENYKLNQNNFAKVIGLFLCVMTFILCGFEHSIADMSYLTLSISHWNEIITYIS